MQNVGGDSSAETPEAKLPATASTGQCRVRSGLGRIFAQNGDRLGGLVHEYELAA
jgi:hypothetical protein